MKFHPDEFKPPAEIVRLITQHCLQPCLCKIEGEAKKALPVNVEVHMAESSEWAEIASGGKSDVNSEPVGIARIRIRHTVRPNRDLFCVQAVFHRDAVIPDTGFSGFRISGELRNDGGAWKIDLKGQTMVYNDYHWDGWFW